MHDETADEWQDKRLYRCDDLRLAFIPDLHNVHRRWEDEKFFSPFPDLAERKLA